MKMTIGSLALAIGMTLAASEAGQAATLGLSAIPPSFGASDTAVDFLEFSADGDLSASDAAVDFEDGITLSAPAEIAFGVGFAVSDPVSTGSGGFDVFDADGLFLSGDLLAVGFASNLIEVQYGALTGPASDLFGGSVLMQIAFSDDLGSDPFGSLVDGQSYDTSITISDVSPIPLPAGLPLLAAGCLMLLILRKHRTRV